MPAARPGRADILEYLPLAECLDIVKATPATQFPAADLLVTDRSPLTLVAVRTSQRQSFSCQ
jgi:hypothetical protein